MVGITRRILLLACFAPPAAAEIASQQLHYRLTYNGIAAGEVRVAINKTDSHYALTLTTRAKPWLQLFTRARPKIETLFIRTPHGPQLHSGKSRAQDGKTRAYQVHAARREIHYANGKTVAAKPAQQIIAAAFPLRLMHAFHRARAPHAMQLGEVLEVGVKRAREYAYARPTKEQLHLATGARQTWRITRARKSRPQSTVSVWFTQGVAAPLKIEVINKNKTYAMQLQQTATNAE